MREPGSSRTILLVALSAAVAVVVGGGWYLVTSVTPDELGIEEGDEAGPTPLVPGAPGPHKPGRAARGTEDPDEEMDDDIIEGDPPDRLPEGEVWTVDDESLRRVLKANVWEEVRRQIDVLQSEGKPIAEDVVRALAELLKTDGRRLDAVLALGQIKDPFAGKLLADFAADTSLPDAARVAALDALAKSGQSAGLQQVRQLVDGATVDSALVRHAYYALAGMGGPDGAAPLLAALAAHMDDDLTDAVATAIAKLKDADGTLAQSLREARTSGNAASIQVMLRVGMRMGATAGPDMQREIRALIESPAGLAALEKDPDAAERLRFDAIYTAGSMGGVALDAVLQIARSESGTVRTVALGAIKGARGDDAATKIAGLMSAELDLAGRYSVIAALGEAGSRKVTATIHAALDDPEGSVREIASLALGQIRDPASVPVILARLDGARGNVVVARNYLAALGQIGVNDALPKLQALAASQDQFWKDQQPWIKQAIRRIQSGNPDATSVADQPVAKPKPR